MSIATLLVAVCGALLMLVLLNPASRESDAYRVSGPLGFAVIALTVLRVTEML